MAAGVSALAEKSVRNRYVPAMADFFIQSISANLNGRRETDAG
jgi:hypothetical protein